MIYGRKVALLWRVPLMVMVAVALFWGCYYYFVGDVPTIETVRLFSGGDETYQFPSPASLWSGTAFAPVWAFVFIGILFLFAKEAEGKYLILLLSIGVIIGLCVGLASGLLTGGSFGIILGAIFGVLFGERHGLSTALGYGLGFGLVYGMSTGAAFGTLVLICSAIVSMLGCVFGAILRFFLSSTPWKWMGRWATAADKE